VQVAVTTEVRWFLRAHEAAVDVLERWFQAIAPEPPREDRYVRTDRHDLGLKVRDAKGRTARFESKHRIAPPTTTRFTATVAGRVERWQKVSLAVSKTEASCDGEMLHVRKVRRVRRYGLVRGQAREVPRDPPVTPCCAVEWAVLEIDATRAPSTLWTLGFEATGEPADQLPCLVAVTREVFADKPELELGLTASFGYAQLVADAI